ncbi:transposase family protein [Actinomadura viridis]|uniref:transposase family protein n=1 Tax=Actinomadura viridis TaxID=58110 RepID=UPI0036B18D55
MNMQVVIDANTRLVAAVGRPVPGDHNDCTAHRDSGVERSRRGANVMADGGYQGNPQVTMPYRRPRDRGELLAPGRSSSTPSTRRSEPVPSTRSRT